MRRHYNELRRRGDSLLTSNLVLAETATRLRYDAGLHAALAFRELIDEAVAGGSFVVRYATRAWTLLPGR